MERKLSEQSSLCNKRRNGISLNARKTASISRKELIDDEYIRDKFDSFLAIAGIAPNKGKKLASAFESIVDSVYNDGYEDAHLPEDNHCVVCGSYMGAPLEDGEDA